MLDGWLDGWLVGWLVGLDQLVELAHPFIWKLFGEVNLSQIDSPFFGLVKN